MMEPTCKLGIHCAIVSIQKKLIDNARKCGINTTLGCSKDMACLLQRELIVKNIINVHPVFSPKPLVFNLDSCVVYL